MEQDTQEWHEFRRNKIGASDAPIILGISPWKTPYQLWEEKVFGKVYEQTSSMARGKALEPLARETFEKMTGIPVMPKVVVHKQRKWQMASLDGITFDNTTIVEIKCPSAEIHGMAKEGKIPDHYMAQIQHQLAVTEAQKAFYFSFDGEKGALVEVFENEEFISDLVEKEEKFYGLMMNQEPPILTERDYEVREDEQWKLVADEWLSVHASLKSLEEKEEALRQQLLHLSKDRNTKGAGIMLTKYACKGRVDYDAVPELKNVNLNQYRKASCQKWRISACQQRDGDGISKSSI
jgi:putative phage-type endonuclease